MRFVQSITLSLAALLFFSGCETTDQTKERFTFSKFEGEQKLWKIDVPTFAARRIGGIDYYAGNDLPSKFHIILGRIYGATSSGQDAALKEIVALTARHGGDGFIEGNTNSAYGGRVVGIEGNVIHYLPEEWMTKSGFIECISAIAWSADNQNGGEIEPGKTLSAEDVAKLAEFAEKRAVELVNDYARSARK